MTRVTSEAVIELMFLKFTVAFVAVPGVVGLGEIAAKEMSVADPGEGVVGVGVGWVGVGVGWVGVGLDGWGSGWDGSGSAWARACRLRRR